MSGDTCPTRWGGPICCPCGTSRPESHSLKPVTGSDLGPLQPRPESQWDQGHRQRLTLLGSRGLSEADQAHLERALKVTRKCHREEGRASVLSPDRHVQEQKGEAASSPPNRTAASSGWWRARHDPGSWETQAEPWRKAAALRQERSIRRGHRPDYREFF